jgi:hypothetical protein
VVDGFVRESLLSRSPRQFDFLLLLFRVLDEGVADCKKATGRNAPVIRSNTLSIRYSYFFLFFFFFSSFFSSFS